MMKRFFAILVLFLTLMSVLSAAERHVLFLAGPMAPEAKRAFSGLRLPPEISFSMVPDGSDTDLLMREIRKADLIIVNGLVVEFRNALVASDGLEKKKIHLLGTDYLRTRIPEKLVRNCQPADKNVAAYRSYASAANLRNMLFYLMNKEWDLSLKTAPPETGPQVGIIDPFTGKIWQDAEAWFAAHPAKANSRGRVAVLVYRASAVEGK